MIVVRRTVTVIHGIAGCTMIVVRRTVVADMLQCGWVQLYVESLAVP